MYVVRHGLAKLMQVVAKLMHVVSKLMHVVPTPVANACYKALLLQSCVLQGSMASVVFCLISL